MYLSASRREARPTDPGLSRGGAGTPRPGYIPGESQAVQLEEEEVMVVRGTLVFGVVFGVSFS